MIIPKNIPECFKFLEVLVDKETIDELKSQKRADLSSYDTNLRIFIGNNWLYSQKSPLVETLKFLGMTDFNESALSELIIEAFWEYLNGLEFSEDDFAKKMKNLNSLTSVPD